MKARHWGHRTTASVCTAVAAAGLAVATIGPARGDTAGPIRPTTAPISVGVGQRLRLTVISASDCSATVTFNDRSGHPVGPPADVRLKPGQPVMVDNPDFHDPSGSPSPAVIVPTVRPVPGSCALLAGTELFDGSSGRTISAVTAWLGHSGPSSPTFAPIGLVPGQTIRVSIVNVGTQPCSASMTAIGPNGQILARQFVTIGSGVGSSLDAVAFQKVDPRPNPMERRAVLALVGAGRGCELVGNVAVLGTGGSTVMGTSGIGSAAAIAGFNP